MSSLGMDMEIMISLSLDDILEAFRVEGTIQDSLDFVKALDLQIADMAFTQELSKYLSKELDNELRAAVSRGDNYCEITEPEEWFYLKG